VETASGTLLRTLEGHQSPVFSVAFDPTGRTLACGSADRTVKLWEAASGRLLHTLERLDDPVENLAFTPDGHGLVACTSGRLHLWDLSGTLPRHLATRWLRGPRGQRGIHFLAVNGQRLLVPELFTDVRAYVSEIRFDQADAEPMTGDPQALLAEWMDRFSLKFARTASSWSRSTLSRRAPPSRPEHSPAQAM